MSCDKLYLRKDLITCDSESGVSLKDLLIQIIQENPELLSATNSSTPTSSAPTTLDGLSDVTSPNPLQGDLLVKGSGDWINTPGMFSLLKYKASTTARQSNPNVTMGSVNSSYSFEGKTLQQIMEDMFFIYQAPTFSTFTIGTSPLYVGEKVPQSSTFSWTYTNPSNITGPISIRDNTNNTDLYTTIPVSQTSQAHNFSVDIVKYGLESHVWQITGINSIGGTFSRTRTINWGAKIFTCIGSETTFNLTYLYTNGTLNGTSRQTTILLNRQTDVEIDTNGEQTYKFILIPISATFNSTTKSLFVTSGISFTDNGAPSGLDAYDAVTAGTTTITNEYGVAITYQIYIGPNPSSAPFNIKIN
jgi:hypothetical protein